MSFFANKAPDPSKPAVVTLHQDSGDVNIHINGTMVAYICENGQLRRNGMSESAREMLYVAGVRFDDHGRIKTNT